MNLFEECLGALGQSVCICKQDVAEKILANFDQNFPLTSWGRIDWNKIKEKKIISSIEDIIPTLTDQKRNFTGPVYIIGSDPTIPILECSLDKILEFFDDVEAMSPNTWLFCPSNGWVIEFYHEGEITIGWVDYSLQ